MARTAAVPAFPRSGRPAVAAIVAAVLLVAVLCVRPAVTGSQDQAAASLRRSILAAADQCAAVEGAYPADIRYLRDRYGVLYDTKRFDVRYEAFAGNLQPSVVVRAR